MLTSIDVKFPSSFACFLASSGDYKMFSSVDSDGSREGQNCPPTPPLSQHFALSEK